MSDQTDYEEDAIPSNAADISSEQDSDESGTEQGDSSIDGFFNMEAEESDGYGEDEHEEDEEDEEDGHSKYGRHVSFPQFSRLPPELRITIWEALDPHLRSKARVFPLHLVINPPDVWETALLASQTAPARRLLATCRESRSFALPYYPDVIPLRNGLGDLRFNGANDIILLKRAHHILDIRVFGPWFGSVKYLGFEYSDIPPELYSSKNSLSQVCQNIEAVFCCFNATFLGHRLLDWTVFDSSKQFYFGTSRSDEPDALYCWPDTKLHGNLAAPFSEDVLQFLYMPPSSSVPVLPMALYSLDADSKLYHKAKRRHERQISRGTGSDSPIESSSSSSSEGESFYESEPDDYELDDFVVRSPSEGSEESSEHEDLADEEGGGDNAGFDPDPGTFNGFSPIQEELSDDEGTGNLPNAAITISDSESDEHHSSDAQPSQEQPRTATKAGRRKRHVLSSDDEDDGEETLHTRPRVKKRARVILSDSENDEEGSGNSPVSEKQGPSRLKKRPRIVLSDSESEDEDEMKDKSEDGEDDEDEEDVTEDEDGDGSEEERPVSKPVSLLARLRQFRSDIPVSPERNSQNSSVEESDAEELSEDDEGRGLYDAEFPDSAAEDYEDDGW
ncbi:hypothetical protein F5Y07DRAFT_356145 [Xylaria sp. FL0933]|nr:hypothetical protein F5Y07DRAFT_356145 [Xylaria sp. FL0933]